jgi:PAS domain S-box-containing protein
MLLASRNAQMPLSWRRFGDWPVRAGIAAILVVASSLPLIIAAVVDIRRAKSQLLEATADVLAARGDQLVRELDAFNRGYQRTADEIAHWPDIIDFLPVGKQDGRGDGSAIRARLAVIPARDPSVRSVAILDTSGVVRVATNPRLLKRDLSHDRFAPPALRGAAAISDIFVSDPEAGSAVTIAYLSPIRDADGEQRGVAVLFVKAESLWGIASDANSLAGEGSFAVLFDQYGIRVAHTYSLDIVFHPGGQLDAATVAEFVRHRRFGPDTQRLLEDVRPFPEQFDRARAAAPDTAMFRGFAPVDQTWNYGVARRMQSAPWTLFYMTPTSNLEAQVAEMTRQRMLFAAAIVALALTAGFFVALAFLRPLRALSRASNAIASGDLGARVPADRGNEIGQLASSFNAMAERIEAQAAALRQSRDALEARVDERTAALRMSEERTRLIIDTALDAVVTIDAAGMVTGWSPQAEAIFGWTAADVMGRVLADLIIPERYRDAHRQGMQRYHATGEGPVLNTRIELDALHRQGHEFSIELAITALRSDHDVSFSAFVRDITDRKRAEEGLRDSEERFRTLAESLPQLVWTCAPDGYCDYLSRQWVEYTGQPAEEQLGSGWAAHLHPDDRARVQAEWAAATARGDLFDVEFRIHRFDGAYRWFKTRAVPLRDAHGRIIKWFGSNTDFEAEKQSEARLQSHLERLHLLDQTTRAIGERHDLRSIFRVMLTHLEDNVGIDFGCVCLREAATDALIVTTVGTRSQAFAPGLGLEEQTRLTIDRNGLSRALGGELVHEPDLSELSTPLATMLTAGGLRSVVLAPLAVESRVFGVLMAGRRAAQGFASSDCEFLRQLSQHVALAANQAQLYAALQHAYDEIRQSQQGLLQHERLRALGQMASGIAHDINNALSPVVLYTEALIEGEHGISEQGREFLKTIQHAVEDIAQTIGRMREFYRGREAQTALEPVDLNSLVQQAVELTRARWSDMPQQRGVVVNLKTDLAPTLPAVPGLASEIREALINLIFNAVDAMPDGGTVMLRTYVTAVRRAGGPSEHVVCLDVTDTGVGMDEETQRRCLEPFYTTKGERGTGLGLAMVYGAMQRQGAGLDIETARGVGTTVRLSFSAAATGAAAPEAAVVQKRPTPLRVLLIDDDPLVIRAMRSILTADGHIVTTAEGGQQGIDTFKASRQPDQQPFAVVITDLGMPYVDGRKVAAAIKHESASTPVILLTGWGQRLEAEGDTPDSVDYVLGKPPKIAELRSVLAKLAH